VSSSFLPIFMEPLAEMQPYSSFFEMRNNDSEYPSHMSGYKLVCSRHGGIIASANSSEAWTQSTLIVNKWALSEEHANAILYFRRDSTPIQFGRWFLRIEKPHRSCVIMNWFLFRFQYLIFISRKHRERSIVSEIFMWTLPPLVPDTDVLSWSRGRRWFW
jgi:hypothetical protein